MKLIKFKAKRVSDNKVVRGNWLAGSRPHNAQKIAERLVGYRLTNFVSVTSDIKLTMVNYGVE